MEKGVIMAYVKYILKKLIQIVVITFLVSLLVFFSLRLNPTSPLTVIIGNKQSTPELQQQYTEQFDLDEPLLKQYIIWLKGIAHGDLGIDYVQKQPILNQIIDRIPITLGLFLNDIRNSDSYSDRCSGGDEARNMDRFSVVDSYAGDLKYTDVCAKHSCYSVSFKICTWIQFHRNIF